MTNGVLKGTVTDGTNPIGNAVVYIENLKISSITEADGSFDFGEIEAGEYDILIEADGYASKTIKVNIEAGKTTIPPVEIQKLRNVDISGRLVSEDGNPIEGGSVTAKGYSTVTTVSAADGTFSFQQLAAIDKVTVSIHRYMMDDAEKEIVLTESNTVALGDVAMTAKRLSPRESHCNVDQERCKRGLGNASPTSLNIATTAASTTVVRQHQRHEKQRLWSRLPHSGNSVVDVVVYR